MTLLEIVRTVVVPLIIALATLYAGSKINDSRSNKLEKNEAIKQLNKFHLKLERLIKSVEKYGMLNKDFLELKIEGVKLRDGIITYDQEDYVGITFSEYVELVENNKADMIKYSLPKAADEVNHDFNLLNACSIDKLSHQEDYKCVQILEIGSKPENLLAELQFLKQISEELKP